jgi:glycosyltransferase involved in cell wall biosynthesis
VKICYVISGLNVGGAEIALLRLCCALRASNVQAAVVSVSGPGLLGPQFAREGISVLALNMHFARGAALAVRRFKSYLSGLQPHLIHGWMYHGNLLATALCRADGVQRPVLWGIRQSLQGNRDKLRTRVLIRVSAVLSERSEGIVYNSVAGRRQHEAIGFSPKRAHVISNGFDTDLLKFDGRSREALRTSLGFSSNTLLIGHVARFHPSKDHVGFLRAFALVAESRANVRAVLAGEGVDWRNRELTSLIFQLGIADRVRLLGRQTDIRAFMSSLDLLCSSSSGMEGFPNVVAEAMCCQVPCVATNVGDALEVIGEAGEVVPAGDARALSAALARMVDLPADIRWNIGQAARARIAIRYGIDTVAARYLNLYCSVLGGASKCVASPDC